MSNKKKDIFPMLFLPQVKSADAIFFQLVHKLHKVLPLKNKFKAALPGDIKRLSKNLTESRSEISKDYMGAAATFSAYFFFFLPWNLYRMGRLFTGLKLELEDGAVIADVGSGPLTAPIAMWMSSPHLREKKLEFICLDISPRAMRDGMKLFESIAGKETPWRIHQVKGSVGTRLRKRADLVIAANVINELQWGGNTPMEYQAERMVNTLSSMVTPEGRILLVEPGVRRSGMILRALRSEFLDSGYVPLAPCTHCEECPMTAIDKAPWCHFNFGVGGAPQWLKDLSFKAGLHKRNVSMSFLYLTRAENFTPAGGVRSISENFPTKPGFSGQYGCCEKGLTLVQTSAREMVRPGTLLQDPWPEKPEKDRSGALIFPVEKAMLNPMKQDGAGPRWGKQDDEPRPVAKNASFKGGRPKNMDEKTAKYKRIRPNSPRARNNDEGGGWSTNPGGPKSGYKGGNKGGYKGGNKKR
ncbi:MAG: small ribosomal subunit Rsm22 family protein [Desulfovibrio sp.]